MNDDYDLEDVDARGHARAQGAAGLGDDDEDEDGVPPGAERMQCASQ
jgi:DnaJ homolog subfamily A member 2